MENASYAGITRQQGLMAEMRTIANNIANASTTGFKAEEVMFSEYIGLARTGGPFDLAIEGDGFFLVETPNGERLTRAGSFTPNGDGDLVTMDGYPVLDAGGAPVFIPQDAGEIGIAPDGTISAGGNPVGQIGLVLPADPLKMTREGGTLFNPQGGFDAATDGRMMQGFLEQSNVNPIIQIGRMIEVQRAYELGQSFMEKEDERIRGVIQSLSR